MDSHGMPVWVIAALGNYGALLTIRSVSASLLSDLSSASDGSFLIDRIARDFLLRDFAFLVASPATKQRLGRECQSHNKQRADSCSLPES
jgi:hypothetical protein